MSSDKNFPDSFPETCRGEFVKTVTMPSDLAHEARLTGKQPQELRGRQVSDVQQPEPVVHNLFRCSCGSMDFNITPSYSIICAGCGRYAGSNNLRWN